MKPVESIRFDGFVAKNRETNLFLPVGLKGIAEISILRSGRPDEVGCEDHVGGPFAPAIAVEEFIQQLFETKYLFISTELARFLSYGSGEAGNKTSPCRT